VHVQSRLRLRAEGAGREQEGIAGQERRHHQARLREDDQPEHRVGPQPVRGDDLGEVPVDVDDEVHQLADQV